MKLVHSLPHPHLIGDPRSLQILLGLVSFVCALLWVLYLALNARPVVEGIFAAMNASILSLVHGAAH